ncbi:MAG: peptidoglycan DD-metalloendopeptidase family protein [Oscillospiraceae bacterium]
MGGVCTLSKRGKQDFDELQPEQLEQSDNASQQSNEQTEQEQQNSTEPQLAQPEIEIKEIHAMDEEEKNCVAEDIQEPEKEPQMLEPEKEDEAEVSAEKFDFYEYVTSIGQTVGKGFLSIFSFIGFIIMLPIDKIWYLMKKLWAWLDKALIDSLRVFGQEWSYFRTEVKSSKDNLKKAFQDSPKSAWSIFVHYVKKAFDRHPTMFKSISNIVMPVVAAVVLISTISYWNSVTFALEVQYKGQNLGYISDESVYLTAQELVKEKMQTVESDEEVFDAPEYKLALVKPNELTDAQTISDRIVENSESDITPAVGIYINGQFICAIKNEMDASQLFNSILDEYKSDDPNDVVGFIEDVKYVQGLYPDNKETIWDTQKLRDTLKGKKAEAVYYTVQTGDTISGIAHANGLKIAELFAINPGVTENIKIGDQVLVSNQVNYLRIKVVKTEIVNQNIAYETVNTENPKLYKGTKKVKRTGAPGVSQVTQLVTYVDGIRVGVEEINRVTVKEPVSQLVDIGVKSASISGGGSSGGNVRPTSGKLVWPIVGLYRVNSPYGPRNGGFHRGMDLSGPNASGHLVVAAASGRVTASGWGGPYGNRVIIDHGNGMSTLYAHCLSGSLSVGVGQYVNAGDAIARVGSTGNSTGPHLHFEVRIGGKHVNPAPYLGLR